jgi:hypothetical protein
MSELPMTMSGMVLRSSLYVLRNLPQVLRAEPQPASYDMLFKDPRDGCARHDDVWGG